MLDKKGCPERRSLVGLIAIYQQSTFVALFDMD
jgi:hypothetical protein